MSTRSAIGVMNDDGSVEAIYCHWDGYPERTGKTLFGHYRDVSKIRELLQLGGIESVRPRVKPDPGEVIDDRAPGCDVVRAHHRDMGLEYYAPTKFASKKNYEESARRDLGSGGHWLEYLYLYEPDGWHVYDMKNEHWHLLERLLSRMASRNKTKEQ